MSGSQIILFRASPFDAELIAEQQGRDEEERARIRKLLELAEVCLGPNYAEYKKTG